MIQSGTIVRLQIGRACDAFGDGAKARTAYEEFLRRWQDACERAFTQGGSIRVCRPALRRERIMPDYLCSPTFAGAERRGFPFELGQFVLRMAVAFDDRCLDGLR